MAVLKFISWNIKHFSGRNPRRLSDIISYLKYVNADIISLYEVKGSLVFDKLGKTLPGYIWMTTSGPQSQEILVGVRASLGHIGFEQTDSFKSGNNFLRPGMLTTIQIKGRPQVTFLSLHLKSHADYMANAIRAEQFRALYSLSKSLRRKGIKLIAMGDLNTMGLDLPYGYGFGSDGEFKLAQRKIKNAGLRLIDKDWDHTWSPSENSDYPPSDLDHVIAHKDVVFIAQGKSGEAIKVDWPRGYSPRSNKSEWYRDTMSDHAPLIGAISI